MKEAKTNAMRILDKDTISYKTYSYESGGEAVDGVTVAYKIGKDPQTVFKTLVVQGASKAYYVAVIPVAGNLDLKGFARILNEKHVELIAVKDLLQVTGYIRGGCSPIGMKKQFPTYIDQSAADQQSIIVSGGKIGLQLELAVCDLLGLHHISCAPLCI